MRNVASLALTTSAFFLVVVAVLLNSIALFYMGTAMIATLATCRLQAWLAVRGLSFKRRLAPTVRIGDFVTIEIEVSSDHSLKRPLVLIDDGLPARVMPEDMTPSLPIAPDGAAPVVTQYRFRPMRRGVYRWSTLKVLGTDSLGLVRLEKTYRTEPIELTVLPLPVPVQVRPPRSAGWGAGEVDHGRSRGTGIDPWGIRDYQHGDSLRHVHWRSSAKTGQLLVKEFEVGMFAHACFFFQATRGTEIGDGPTSSLDLMCAHGAHIAEGFLRQGIALRFPGLESGPQPGGSLARTQQVLRTLARIEATSEDPLGVQVLKHMDDVPNGASVYLFVTVGDESLPPAIAALRDRGCQAFALLYDPRNFAYKKLFLGASATDPEFMSRLRTAGAEISIMPKGDAS